MSSTSAMRLAKLALLFYAVGAVRVTEDFTMDVVHAKRDSTLTRDLSLTSDTSMICGGPEIWGEVVQERSALASAMNINWKQAEAFKVAFMDQQSSREGILAEKLEKLAGLLEAELANEKPRTTEEHIKGLLEAGLGEGSYGGVENARALKCGKPGVQRSRAQRPKRGAFTESQKLFAAESGAFFGKAELRLDGDLFLKVCHAELVEQGEARAESWCVELCQRLKDIAASDSKSALGETAGASDRLRDEIVQAKRALDEVAASKEQCESDWSSLAVFRDQLLGMKATAQQRVDEMMEAEQALDDAMFESEELQDSLEAMEAELGAAGELLSKAGAGSAEATAALEEAATKEKDLSGRVQAALDGLGALRGELRDAQAADDMVEKLKAHVTRTMLAMAGFSSAAIREPLRNLGFEDPDAEATAFPEPETTGAAGATKAAVESMHGYCESTAMPAFEEVKQMISVGGEPLDLTDLCRFANPDAIFKDFGEQVKLRAQLVKKDLEWLESWLNPYRANRGLSMREGLAKTRELVREGQLANLEEVKSDYSGSAFFNKYLIGWRKGGPHHLKVAGLASAVEGLRAAEAELQAKLDGLQEALLAAQRAHAAAVESLKRASEAEALAADKKAELEQVVAKLEEQAAQLSRDLSELEAAVAKARKEVKEAEAALAGTYTEATTEGQALAELEAESAQVQQRILKLERAIA